MAEMSYLQIHDSNRNHHERRRHHLRDQSLTRILDSLPHWIQSDDDDIDFHKSDPEFSGDGVDLLGRRSSFVMDLFHQRVEQSQVISPIVDDEGVVGEGSYSFELDLELDLELESGFVENLIGGGYSDLVVSLNVSDEHDDDDEEDSFDDVIVTIESCFDSDDCEEDDAEKEKEIWGLDLNDYDDDDDDESVTVPLCWDSLQLEDDNNEEDEFEWEEVDDNEREADDNNSVSVSVSATISSERRGYLGWEVLLNSHSLEFNLDDVESNMELYIGDIDHEEEGEGDDDYLHTTTEYEMLFEAEISSSLGKPPASKSFIKNLKVSTLSTENDESVCCAVCKEEMNVEKEVAELPCRHKYHKECIVPWLGIRNTCPVCRFELPSDEIEIEQGLI